MATTSAATSGPATRQTAGVGREELDDEFNLRNIDNQTPPASLPFDSSLAYNGKRSLASIGIQAFWLGFALAIGLIYSLQLIQQGVLLWRLFAFVASFSLFHFLEYWTTARFNTPVAEAGSFLLFTNGHAYNAAYGLAVVEVLLSALFFQDYARWYSSDWSKLAGLLLVILGQVVRSVAMAQAGTNFNHIPQRTRKEGHVLVTRGVYSWLRHPSYFGFFWWAIGTQLLVGNKFCLLGYILVLWRFFQQRIIAEERFLVSFFGDDYVAFRSKTRTGIPFVK